MQCVILAGGLGTRLWPMTQALPKSLIPISGRPFADYQLTWLSRQNITDVVYCIGYLGGQIRAAIGDHARTPKYLRTVHAFGYAFVGPASEAAAPAAEAGARSTVRLSWGEREIELPLGESVLGRAPGCAVWIDASGISRRHARLVVSETGAVLEDLGSKNGTYVAGRKVAGPTPLANGDEICFGSTNAAGSVRMRVHVFQDTGSTRSEPSA